MEQSDIKVIEFREKLMKLCNEYKCSIRGSCNDFDDDYVIEFNDGCEYLVQADGISMYKIDINDKRQYIIDEYVINIFGNEKTEMQGLNNIKVSCIVFSNDPEKANNEMEYILSEHILLDEIYEVRRMKEGIKEIKLKNGERYIWLKPNENAKGYRCNHAYIDRNLSLEVIENNIIPIAFYCSKDTVEMF